MRCDKCEYWLQDKDDCDSKVFQNIGKCTKVKQFWDCTDWDEDYNRVLLDKYKDYKAFAKDGSDYYACLMTLGDFGCVQFEDKK